MRAVRRDRWSGAAARACSVLLACGSAGFAARAQADVIEIAPDGAVAIRAGTGAVRWHGGAKETEPPADVDPSDIPLPDGAASPFRASSALPEAAAAVPAPYRAAIARIAAANDMSPALLEALVWQESRWNAAAVSKAGAIGLAQLMPATARALGVDPRDPIANLDGGARCLRRQLDLFDGDIEKALAAYNAGPARVLRAGGIPPIRETQAYVAAIVDRLATAVPTAPAGE